MRLRIIAEQVAAALPEGADLADLMEFLEERASVEQGRDDFDAGRTVPDPLGGATGTKVGRPEWSRNAASELDESLRHTLEHHGDAARHQLLDAVHGATTDLASGDEQGVTLPEMGDKTIRETYLYAHNVRYRLVYDEVGAQIRILWFTSNITCYRNVTPLVRPTIDGTSRRGARPRTR